MPLERCVTSRPGIIHGVSADAFIRSQLKNDQVLLEKRLWEERQAIQKRHEEKVKVARTKYVSITSFPTNVLEKNV